MTLDILRKDLQNLRPWIAAAAASWLLIAIPMQLDPSGSGWDMPLLLLAVLIPPIVSIVALERLIHADSFVGTDGFLATRPVTRLRTLGEKLLFAFLFLVIPGAIVRFALYATLASALPPAGFALLLAQEISYGAALLAVFLLPACWTASLARMIMVTLCWLLALGMLLSFLSGRYPSAPSLINPSHWTIVLMLALFEIVAVLAAIAAACVFVKLRRLLPGIVFIVVAAAACFTPWGKLLPSAPPANVTASSSIRLRYYGPPSMALRSKNSLSQVTDFSAQVQIENLPPLQIVTPSLAQTHVDLSGSVRDFNIPQDSFVSSDRGFEKSAAEMLGLKSASDGTPLYRVVLACGTRAEMQMIDPESLTGTLVLDTWRPRLLAELPMRAGATATAGQFHFRVIKVRSSGSAAEIKIQMKSLDSPLLPIGRNNLSSLALALGAGPSSGHMTHLAVSNSSSSLSMGAYVNRVMGFRFEPGDAKNSNAPEFPASGRLALVTAWPGEDVIVPLPPITKEPIR